MEFCLQCNCEPCTCLGFKDIEPGTIIRVRRPNGQSRKGSLFEIICSTTVGYFVALGTQLVVFPLYGIQSSASHNIQIALIFTFISIIRGYIFRRVFNSLCK